TGDARGPTFGPDGFVILNTDGSPIPAGDLPLVRAIERGQATREYGMIIRRNDGTERVLLTTAAPQLDADGNISGGIAVFQDITERERAARDRALSQTILDGAGNAIIYI